MIEAILIVAGYLAGSLPFGYWLVRWRRGVDIRTVGSGNIGATNVWRTYGRWYGLPVILLDVLKGFVPALLGTLLGTHWVGVLAGAAAMAGHYRPLFLRFSKGGKMVATLGGAMLGVAPYAGLSAAGLWIALFLALRYASLSSLLAAASLPLLAWGFAEPWPVIAFCGAAAAGVIALHRANIKRLLTGTESRFERRRGPRPSGGSA